MIPNLPTIGFNPGGGLSFSDTTRISFDPYADNSKTNTFSPSITTGGSAAAMWLPLALVAVVGFLIWRLLK